ncbi:hypothetical protein ED28_01500 [[Pantoea] beijingensis]|uniref:Phage shock protein D n=1 Tax=[Pantoea] beijingensis TaxID=1324864 RepID=A0A443II53_9GAMM|nr:MULTISPECIES: phage shock protein PspD [Erwiniaceae]RWR03690.1 hypothetical protein ED28_01500 [[Pantoea] beijingensis]
MRQWQQRFRQHAAPALKSVGKFMLINAISYGPAGITGWAVKSVARRPLKIALAVVLEPLLKRATAKIVRAVARRAGGAA